MSTRDQARNAEQDLQRQMDDALRRTQNAPLNPNPAGGSGDGVSPNMRPIGNPSGPPNMTPSK